AQALARVAVDPGAESRGEIETRGRALVGADDWDRLTFSALSDARRWALAQSDPFSFDRSTGVADRTGKRVTVNSVMAPNGLTVLLTFAAGCGGCIQAAPAIEALHRQLDGTGARVAVVSHDDPLEDTFFDDREMTVPVVYDVDRSVSLALGSAATPNYYVVDRAGVARYVPSLGDVARYLDALESE
ncbi:peroxiredoxin family protein, partial [Rubrivirga sp.]|uniref:peroxiredoxin family protein n=1 Tax=Rubrivirga sp. TaxID=1885344 RepID=UPI003C79344D